MQALVDASALERPAATHTMLARTPMPPARDFIPETSTAASCDAAVAPKSALACLMR